VRPLTRRGWRSIPWATPSPRKAPETCSAGGFGGDAGLLLDVTGCGHLFGPGEAGERALLADLTTRLSRHDFACRAALADTAGAAWALARYAEKQADLFCPRNCQRSALATLPVDGLRLDKPILKPS
jgi:protein ImuB